MKTAIVGLVLILCAWVPFAPPMLWTGSIMGRVTSVDGKPLAYANVLVVGTTLGAMTRQDGSFVIAGVPAGTLTVRVVMMGFKQVDQKGVFVRAAETTHVSFRLESTPVVQTQRIEVRAQRPMVEIKESKCAAPVTERQLSEMAVEDVLEGVGLKAGIVKTGRDAASPRVAGGGKLRNQESSPPLYACVPGDREQYDAMAENRVRSTIESPVSTFSIDVDAASYGNARRFVRSGRLPPPSSVRVEEFVNYFDYDYPDPDGDVPFSVVTEVAGCPWNAERRLVHIGLQGRRVRLEHLPPNNLVFLIDVSGSMQPENKLPLIQTALPMLVSQMRPVDRVAIVVYAGAAGLVLDSTPGNLQRTILQAVGRLSAGGSTAGGAGIALAYETAARNFIEGGNNRVILATDGDFNVGVSSDGELVRMIEEKRASGVFLTVIGVGEGNLQDAKMEKLADHGNGNYVYFDDLPEAQKVLVTELGATLLTIAQDVKVQVEFNPARVKSYRLVGYENRMLQTEDFADDRKDAGELGAGHSVTALYEIEPADGAAVQQVGHRYMDVTLSAHALRSKELLTVRLRYKEPRGKKSRLIEQVCADDGVALERASDAFRFAAAVAELALLLRDSDHAGRASYDRALAGAESARGRDPWGHREDFIRLATECRTLAAQMSRE